jgi:hypothetical protein
MRLTEYIRSLNLTQEQEQAIIELSAKRFGLLPNQVELLRIDKNGWVYPKGYEELAVHWDKLTEPIFKEVI